MANPQKEDGFAPIANEILDALCRKHVVLSDYEWTCLMFIFRKTYGWSKKEDQIALSQFVEGTHIKKPHVCRALKKLIRKNFVTQSGNGRSVTYSFQKNYEKWQSLPNQVILPVQVTDITQSGNKSLPNQGHTKESKDTKQKKVSVRFFSFEEIWNLYPNKVGRKAAERHFKASVKEEKDFAEIKIALKNYTASDNVRKGFVQNGSTWFNNWRDWIVNPVKNPNAPRKKVFTKNPNCACCHGTGINPDIPSKPNCQFCWS